jgi:hypothetical protein
MAESLERQNRPILPNSIAFYSIQRCRSGRRSYSGGRTDALSAATVLDGNSSPVSNLAGGTLKSGTLSESGGAELALELEEKGYSWVEDTKAA